MNGPKNSIVEGGCGGPGRDFWIFGPIGWLALWLGRRGKRVKADAVVGKADDGQADLGR